MPTPPTEPPPTGPVELPGGPGGAAGVQATFAATLVDEWVRDGLTDAVVCPGSRSTPLALALADHPHVRVHVHHDERSGAFLALGVGLATGHPALVLTTSGTAAAELHPAVVEADLAGVPLLVCTADRPPELRDVGAPQAIDQVHLYGRSVRWYGDPGVPEASGAGRWRAFAARAYATAVAGPPGPVHLNLPFREPLVGRAGPLPPGRGDGPWSAVARTARPLPPARGDGAWLREVGAGARAALPPAVRDLVDDLAHRRRGLVMAGAAAVDGIGLHEVAGALGWPVVAEPRSPAWIAAPALVDHFDVVVRSALAASDLRPEVIVRVGAPGSSRVVGEWLAGCGAREVVVGTTGWSDPSGTVVAHVEGDPDVFLAALGSAARAAATRRPAHEEGARSWSARWQAAAAAATRAVDRALAGTHAPARAAGPDPDDQAGATGSATTDPVIAEPTAADPPTAELTIGVPTAADPAFAAPAITEPAIARAVVRALPEGAHLVVSSSMPIRDVERYVPARPPGPGGRVVTVHANRGANGIDGVVSTALGVATGVGGPTALLVGDVAFLHDSNGLLGAATRDLDLVCVVVDNDGGGIFSFLPQAAALTEERFEALFGTPHGLDLVALASAYGVDARRVGAAESVAEAVSRAVAKGGLRVLVVATDRRANVAVHRRVDEAAAAAVDRALAGE